MSSKQYFKIGHTLSRGNPGIRTQREVAKMMHIPRSTVQYLECIALGKLIVAARRLRA